MTSEPSAKLPRKKRSILWWIGGAFLLLVVLFLWQLFGPSPPIVVSRETTYITQPLKADGLPDYERYVLELCRKGVKPEDNAAVLLYQAMWPGELDPPQYEAVSRELGLQEVPSAEDSLQPVRGKANGQRVLAWLQTQGQPSATLDTAKAIIDRAMSAPWDSEKLPPLADWVRENQEPLDLLVVASKRPHFYPPSPSLLDDVDEPIVEMWIPGAPMAQEAARALAVRAMWRLGKRHIDEAWQDISAIHRWARLVAEGNMLVEQLMAFRMNDMACRATLALIDSDKLTPAQARRVQKGLQRPSEFSALADSLDTSERISYLDALIRLRAGEYPQWVEMIDMNKDFGKLLVNITRPPADWNVALRQGNEYYGRLVTVARMRPGKARAEALSQLRADLDKTMVHAKREMKSIARLKSQQERGELYSSILLSLFMPATDATIRVQDRANATLELSRLAAALAVYRAEHGAYPEKVGDLAPDVVPKLPVDLYNGKPFIYQRDGEGYLLYSAGENGTDDGGSHRDWDIVAGRSLDGLPEAEADKLRQQIPAGADDISIRVPRPALELPEPQP